MIIPDITIFVQLFNFIITLIFLNYLLIKPIRTILAERRKIISGFVDSADKFNADAAERLLNYEKSLVDIRAQATRGRDAIKADGEQREAEVLAKAQSSAASLVESAKARISKESAEALQILRPQVSYLAKSALEKVLA